MIYEENGPRLRFADARLPQRRTEPSSEHSHPSTSPKEKPLTITALLLLLLLVLCLVSVSVLVCALGMNSFCRDNDFTIISHFVHVPCTLAWSVRWFCGRIWTMPNRAVEHGPFLLLLRPPLCGLKNPYLPLSLQCTAVGCYKSTAATTDRTIYCW